MAQDYSLDTPEAVNVAYPIAGIGTRFLAALIDSAIWLVAQIVIVLGSVFVFTRGGPGDTIGVILLLTLSFILFWGYYIVFETLWRGQTPGKRLMKVRVIKTSGYPIGFVEAVIRNLVRIVDFLPAYYGVGVLTMFISTQSRRLGDYAAGTIVVKERGPVSLRDLDVTAQRAQAPPVSMPRLGEIDPDEIQWNLRALTAEDLQIVNEYLERLPSLYPDAQRRLGETIAERTAQRIGARLPLDPVRFLQRVIYLQQSDQ